MVLGGNYSEVPVVEASISKGYRTIVVDREDNIACSAIEGAIIEQASIADKETILELAKKYNIDGIIASVDAGVRTAAYIAQVMGLPGISEEAAFMGTDKVAMRKRLKQCNIPIPEFYEVQSKDEYLSAISNFDEKCIVKPADSSGSRGVFLLDDLKDQTKINFAYDYCSQFSSTGALLVEEAMEGPEICVETLSSDGICYPVQVSDQLQKRPPYFTDRGYTQPAKFPQKLLEQIKQIAVDANMAIENYQGSSCTEMIITEDGPKIVELGVRLSGDLLATEMVRLSNGVDMSMGVVNIALNDPVDVTPKFEMATSMRYFMKERVGTIKEITGIEEAKRIPGVVSVGILKGIGEEATLLRKSSDRLGFVITQAPSATEADAIADKAIALIDFIVE